MHVHGRGKGGGAREWLGVCWVEAVSSQTGGAARGGRVPDVARVLQLVASASGHVSV